MKITLWAKLHKAQTAIGNMLPYEDMLHRMLANLIAYKRNSDNREEASKFLPSNSEASDIDSELEILCNPRKVRKVAIVACSSNSSLCGGFNSNAIKFAMSVIDKYLEEGLSESDITVFSVGRKMADAMKKRGFESPTDYTNLSERPSYDEAAELAAELVQGFMIGRFDKVELLYNHFK